MASVSSRVFGYRVRYASRLTSRTRVVNVSASATDLTPKEYAKTLPGISAPFPEVFDPAGFLETAKDVNEVRRWREAEITHGRVAMLAALGFVVGEQLEDFPAFMNFDGSITGPAINHFQQVRQGFWEPLLIVIGICESYRVALGWATPTGNGFNNLKSDEEYTMGELFFDPLNLFPKGDAQAIYDLKTKELNNGRLAMIAVSGFVAQEFVNKTEIFQHLARYLEEAIILELEEVEKDLGLPITPMPEIVQQELGRIVSNQ